MTKEEKIDVLIDAMTTLIKIEAQVSEIKDVREALEGLSVEMQRQTKER